MFALSRPGVVRVFSLLAFSLYGLWGIANGAETSGSADAQSANGGVQASALRVYPDSETSFNPRIACIPPVAREGGGKCMTVEAMFRYALEPLVRFRQGGNLKAEVRDNGRRESKEILVLVDANARLALRTGQALKGRIPSLVYIKGGKEIASVPLNQPLPRNWIAVQLEWNKQEAKLVIGGEPAVTMALPEAFEPTAVECQIAATCNLQIRGEGALGLDWKNGYAASVEADPACSDIAIRVFGFDAYAISRNAAKRDYPLVQIQNGTNEKRELTLGFDLRGEETRVTETWKQKVTVPAHSEVMMPVQLPKSFTSDVYHLDIRCENLTPNFAAVRHFMYVEDRDEPNGPVKFGLHDSNRRGFGFWPDSLPISIAHLYAHWGYIQAPMWTKDSGYAEDTAPGEWNWDPRLEQAVQQGLIPYVSVSSLPFQPWMREREFDPAKMRFLNWGTLGGFPKIDKYRKFVKQFATKYKDKVRLYEVENEPNAYLGGMLAADYVEICKALFEEVHAVDPLAKVYGISGTSDFDLWMQKVFAAGGAQWMDGVSVHTYVTPKMPEEANLSGKLATAQALIAGTGKNMPLLNSETGTYVALREEVEHPIAPERLAELIKQGIPGISRPGWPNYAIDERTGSISIVRNVVTNFLGKAEKFVFFGWNNEWPSLDWWTKQGETCFAMVSASKDGKRTPSLYTLAVGVLTVQLKGAKHLEGKSIDDAGVLGGIFPKENGGEVTVLWSPLGKRSVLLENTESGMEIVSLYGRKQNIASASSGGKGLFRLEVGKEPVYIHTKSPGLHLLPSPIMGVSQQNSGEFQFTLVNKYSKKWDGRIEFMGPENWKVSPASQEFSLEPGKRINMKSACAIPSDAKRGGYPVTASMKMPDGTPFSFPIVIEVRPTVAVAQVPDEFEWDQAASWNEIAQSYKLDSADQVVVGHPPLLASLQEEIYWKGPSELSGETKIASDGKNLFIFITVKDENFKLPKAWPGVLGSCVEVFLDFRSTENGQGQPAYKNGVHQLVVKLGEGAAPTPAIWDASERFGKLAKVSAAGAKIGADKYWLALCIPWDSTANKGSAPVTFGFDIGINGPPKNGDGRKSQIMLFGTASNSISAAGFSRATVKANDSSSKK